MKIIFAGSPQYALPSLQALANGGKQVVAVVTQPDKAIGSKAQLTPTPIKQWALEHGISVYDWPKIGEHVDDLRAIGADIMITCAYGQILNKGVLSSFSGGIWNLHASLLPKYRGASPIQSAILAGDEYTGVTVMKTEQELDSGDILLVKRCKVDNLTCGELSERLSHLSAEAAVEAVELLEGGQTQVMLQDAAKVTYCKKIAKSDAKLNFADTAQTAVRLIKAMSPSPAAYCMLGGVAINIYDAELSDGDWDGDIGNVVAADKKNGIVVKCGQGAIKITSAQLAGGKRLQAADLINGRKIKVGDQLD
jgi:methionyl-tRNA formyltransferase